MSASLSDSAWQGGFQAGACKILMYGQEMLTSGNVGFAKLYAPWTPPTVLRTLFTENDQPWTKAAISHGKRYMALFLANHRVKLFDVNADKMAYEIDPDLTDGVTRLEVSDDGHVYLLGQDGNQHNHIIIVKPDGTIAKTMDVTGTQRYSRIDFSGDDLYVYGVPVNGTLEMRKFRPSADDLQDEGTTNITGLNPTSQYAEVSQESGPYLTTFSFGQEYRVTDLRTGQVVKTVADVGSNLYTPTDQFQTHYAPAQNSLLIVTSRMRQQSNGVWYQARFNVVNFGNNQTYSINATPYLNGALGRSNADEKYTIWGLAMNPDENWVSMSVGIYNGAGFPNYQNFIITDKLDHFLSTIQGMDDRPVVQITSPDKGAIVDGVVPFTANVTDSMGPTAIQNVDFFIDNQKVFSDTTAPYGTDWDTNPLPNGQHHLQVVATDADGYTGSDETDVTIQKGFQPIVFSSTPTFVSDKGFHWGSSSWGDVNNDGKPDILVSGWREAPPGDVGLRIAVYTNQGNGTFSEQMLTPVNPAGAEDSRLVDVNRDGWLDVVADGAVYLNKKDGTFETTGQKLPYSGNHLAVGDVDNDGDEDLLFEGPKLNVNKGDGTFAAGFNNIGNVSDISDAVFADMDGDGKMDIVARLANGGSPVIAIYFNLGDGHFSGPHWAMFPVPDGPIQVADLNGDGRLDVVASGMGWKDGQYKPHVWAYLNNGHYDGYPFWTPIEVAPEGKALLNGGLALGDFDNDGDIDVAISGAEDAAPNTNAPRHVRIFLNRGDGQFSPTTYDITPNIGGLSDGTLTAADYDNDGDLDLLIHGTTATHQDYIAILENRIANTNAALVNKAPEKVTNVQMTTESPNGPIVAHISWDPAHDTGNGQTPQQLLMYAVQVKDHADGSYIVSAPQVVRTPGFGNYFRPRMENGRCVVDLSGPFQNGHQYDVSVKAIDAGLLMSEAQTGGGSTGGGDDKTPPTVNITAPADGAVIDWRQNPHPLLTVDASDNVGVTKVELYRDGVKIADTATPPYQFDVANVTQGKGYRFVARAYDAAGNYTDSTERAINVTGPWSYGVVAPTADITSPAHQSTVSPPVQITGTASDQNGQVVNVEFYANEIKVGADTTAPYATTWTPSADGAYDLMIKAWDNDGWVGVSSIHKVNVCHGSGCVDSQPPTVTLDAPQGGDTLSGPVHASATANDNVGVAKVEFYAGATLVGTATKAPFAVDWNTAVVPTGVTELTAKAYDAAGNSGVSPKVVVYVDNTLCPDPNRPTIAIRSPKWDQTITDWRLDITAEGTGNITSVEFYDGDKKIGQVSGSSPYTYLWYASYAKPGDHTLTARAFAPGYVAISAPVHVVVQGGDGQAPNLTVSAPASGATVSGVTAVSFNATDNVGTPMVQALVNGVALGDPVLATSGLSFDSRFVANGTASLVVRATDGAGNQTDSSPISIIVSNTAGADNIAPMIRFTSPVPNAIVTGPFQATVDVRDNASGSGIDKVEYYADGVLYKTATTPPYSLSYQIALSPSVTGISLVAKAYDKAGNVQSTSRLDLVHKNECQPAGLSVKLTSPNDGSTVSGNVNLAADASSPFGAVSKVEFYANGSLISTDDAAPFTAIWDAGSVRNGDYTLTARAYDSQGNTDSDPVTVHVDNAAGVILTTPKPGDVTKVSGKIQVEAFVNGRQGGDDFVVFTVDGKTPFATDMWPVDGVFTGVLDTRSLRNGFHYIGVEYYNGNQHRMTGRPADINVSNSGDPYIEIVTPAPLLGTDPDMPTIVGSAQELISWRVSVGQSEKFVTSGRYLVLDWLVNGKPYTGSWGGGEVPSGDQDYTIELNRNLNLGDLQAGINTLQVRGYLTDPTNSNNNKEVLSQIVKVNVVPGTQTKNGTGSYTMTPLDNGLMLIQITALMSAPMHRIATWINGKRVAVDEDPFTLPNGNNTYITKSDVVVQSRAFAASFQNTVTLNPLIQGEDVNGMGFGAWTPSGGGDQPQRDVTPPTVVAFQPDNNAIVKEGDIFTVDATDDYYQPVMVLWRLTNPRTGHIWSQWDNSAPFTARFPLADISKAEGDGVYALSTTITDLAGNPTVVNRSVILRNGAHSLQAPTVGIYTPAKGAVLVQNHAQPALAQYETAMYVNDDLPGSRVDLYYQQGNGQRVLIGTDADEPYNGIVIDANALPTGMVNLVAVATDVDGLTGEDTRTVEVRDADTENPTVSALGPDQLIFRMPITFAAQAYDGIGPDGQKRLVKEVNVYLQRQMSSGVWSPSEKIGEWIYPTDVANAIYSTDYWGMLPTGIYMVTYEAVDQARPPKTARASRVFVVLNGNGFRLVSGGPNGGGGASSFHLASAAFGASMSGGPMPTGTPVPTATPTPSPTGTPMPTVTPSPTPSPSGTPLPTATPTPTPSPTGTPMPTATPTPTPTPSSTPTPTPTPSPNPSLDGDDRPVPHNWDEYVVDNALLILADADFKNVDASRNPEIASRHAASPDETVSVGIGYAENDLRYVSIRMDGGVADEVQIPAVPATSIPVPFPQRDGRILASYKTDRPNVPLIVYLSEPADDKAPLSFYTLGDNGQWTKVETSHSADSATAMASGPGYYVLGDGVPTPGSDGIIDAKVYPMPIVSVGHIEVTARGDVDMDLFDSTGRHLEHWGAPGAMEDEPVKIDWRSPGPGVYYLKIRAGHDATRTVKVVSQ